MAGNHSGDVETTKMATSTASTKMGGRNHHLHQQPKEDSWPEHVFRLAILNWIFPLLFIFSVYHLYQALQSTSSNWAVKVGLPGIGFLASLTYLFGFFGIPVIMSILSTPIDNASTSSAFQATTTSTTYTKDASTSNQVRQCPSINATKNGNGAGMQKDQKQEGGLSTSLAEGEGVMKISEISKKLPPRIAQSVGETVIVVGAGTAGAAAAIGLAERGFKVTLFERDMSEQDRIVGELLQPGGLRALERLGMDDCAKEGIDSVGVDGYVVFTPNKGSDAEPPKDILLKYPSHDPSSVKEMFGTMQGPTPSTKTFNPKGRSFHNGRFVQRLRERALAEKNVTVVVGIVSKLLEKDGQVIGVEYKADKERKEKKEGTEEEQVVIEKEVRQAYAPLTIIADGLWSSLRTHVDNKAKPTQLSSFVGLILKHPSMESPLPLRGCGHVVLAEPSPVLLYQISSTETRVLVDIHGKMPSASTGELGDHLRQRICPQLPTALQGPFMEAVEKGQFKSMPNRAMPSAKIEKDGVILLGDALNMRHPLTGGGMTVAIRDVEAVLRLLETTDINDPKALRSLKATFTTQRKEWASTINVLANALHAVFSTPGGNSTRKDLRDACFDYLSMGGCYSGGPINLLSGLSPRPSILTTHFFLVALYGVKKYAQPFPTPAKMKRMYDMLHVACKIIMPLLTIEGSTILAFWPVRTLINLIFPWSGGISA